MGHGRVRSLVIAATFPLVVAACSNGDDTGGGAEGEPDQSAEATVAVEESEFGQIVVDSEGQTLYVFLVDEGTDSTCYDDCEANWPPLTVEGDPAGEGIDSSLLGTTEREDGTTQVTLDGHPLYHFAGDETADDINGQDVGDVWYVVSPEGEAITA
ncbi:MAG: COG4315 family predicted lipoprotein [Gaiellales bacterium]